MLAPVLVTGPAADAVDLAAVKQQAQVFHEDEDDVLRAYAAAAISHLDGATGILGRCLIRQTWAQSFWGWGRFHLAFPDVVEASVAISYLGPDGVPVALPPGGWFLVRDASGDVVEFRDGFAWPQVDTSGPPPITVTFQAGYGEAAADVPAPLRVAMALHAAALFDGREGDGKSGTASPQFAALVAPFRRRRFL